LAELANAVEISLMSGGVIILITAAGGAFGAMLKVAEIGPEIEQLFSSKGGQMSGVGLMLLGFSVAAVLKVAQGSSTVAMITASAMLAAIAEGASSSMGYHPVYLATAIGAGSLVGSWMNDSGFWIFAKMSGLTEIEALKSWTILLMVMGFTGLGTTLVLSLTLPLTSAM
jgi:GntP family gluconate:H+ symporter